MFKNQFFSRVELASIIDMYQANFARLEKKGLMEPRIKPSRFDYNQVIFAFLCSELTKYTKLNWSRVIERLGHKKLDREDLNNANIIHLIYYELSDRTDVFLSNDKNVNDKLNSFFTLFNQSIPAVDFEDLTIFQHSITNQGITIEITTISIDKIKEKIDKRCRELGLDIEEKTLQTA